MVYHSLLVLLLLTALSCAAPTKTKTKEEWLAVWNNARDTCKAELKLLDEEIVAISKAGAIMEKNAKCYQFCLGSKLLGAWKTKEEWVEKVHAMVAQTEHKDSAMQLFQMCKDKTGTDECDRLNQVSQCCRDEAKKMGLPASG